MNWDPTFNRTAQLLAKYLRGELTAEDTAELNTWLQLSSENRQLLKNLEETKETSLSFLDSIDAEKAWERVHDRIAPAEHRSFFFKYFKFGAAAAAIVVFITLWYAPGFFRSTTPESGRVVLAPYDLPPGSGKALLTLHDGSVLALEDLPEGAEREDRGVLIHKQNDRLSYVVPESAERAGPAYNTVTTPVGGFYSLLLPDGSMVWLNAGSSIRFPLRFDNTERYVELKGEAFFEVKKRAGADGRSVPFIVKTERGNVEVLGTEFNVAAYPEDPIFKTTLLEGIVRVVSPTKVERILKPGQQAALGSHFEVLEVNTEEVAAWKNGYFYFENRPLEEILQALKRWYEVDVDESDIPANMHFTVSVSREKSLLAVLRMLEVSGELKFELKNKKIEISEIAK